MKKLFKLLSTFIFTFLFITNVSAATANFSVSTSSNQIIVGKTVTVSVTISSNAALGSYEYTLNYDSSVFKCTDTGVGLNYAGVVNNNSTYSITYKYVFQAIKSGTGNFYVDSSNAYDFNEGLMSPSNGAKSVKAITYDDYQASLSKNNNLKNLEVEGYEIEPEFDKDTLEYKVQVKEDETKVNIIATPEDRNSSVTGDGEVDVTSGSNSFDIVVIAENGSEKTYKLTIEVTDKDPIEVKVDGIKYTVVKVKSILTAPTGYTETTIKIKDFDIPGYTSEVTGFNLVGLKDSEGNVSLFIYDDDNYTEYKELNFGKLILYPMDMHESLKGYSKATITIQKYDVECLETSKDSRYKVLYALNIETNEKGLYLYDTKDDMAIKYDSEIVDIYTKQMNLYFYLAIGFAATTLISLITLIAVASKKKKKKVKQMPVTEVEDIDPIIDFDKPETTITETEEVKETVEELKEVSEETKESLDEVIKEKKSRHKKKEIEEEPIDPEEEIYDIFEKPKKKRK